MATRETLAAGPLAQIRANLAQIYPKTPPPAPLPGSVQPEWKRCGKPTCRCATGQLHGPYARYVWRERGRTVRSYVRQADAPAVVAACARWREQRVSGRELLRLARDYARQMDELIAVLEATRRGDHETAAIILGAEVRR